MDEYVERTAQEEENGRKRESKTSSGQECCQKSQKGHGAYHRDDGRNVERIIDRETQIFEHSGEEVEQEVIVDSVS